MRILFTHSSLPLSSWIMGITKEPMSHVVLEFPSLGIVVQSNLLGINIVWADYFRQHETIVAALDNGSEVDDKAVIGKLLDQYEGAWYDYGAFFFIGLTTLLHRYLKLPMPKKNLWQASGMFICTEWVTEVIQGTEDSLITPGQLYEKLKATGKWGDVSNGEGKKEGSD